MYKSNGWWLGGGERWRRCRAVCGKEGKGGIYIYMGEATYQNDYLSLPFTLIDKSCYVNEWRERRSATRYGSGGRVKKVPFSLYQKIKNYLDLCKIRRFRDLMR